MNRLAYFSLRRSRNELIRGFSLTMDNYDTGTIDLHLYHGGKFIEENEYVGGKMELIDGVEYSDITFYQLEVLVKELGYRSVQKWGFREENAQIDKFFIFFDEAVYCDMLCEYVDFEERFVKVYCECIDGDLNNNEGDNEKNLHDSDASDGMEDDDFSSDEEYVETRHILRDIRHSNVGEQAVRHNKYDKTCDHKNLVFEVGMQFKDFIECKEAIRMWAILNGRNVKWSKSDKKCKIEARCEGGCPWRLYASKLNHEATFEIKTFEPEHTCVRTYKNRQANCDWLVNVIMHDLKRKSDYPAKDIVDDVRLKYDVCVDVRLCYKAKWKALRLLRGTLESHYSKLRSYIAELQWVDREGVFLLKTYLNRNDQPIFQRCYIGFSALKKGFLIGCRKCICFDACFLKTVLGGAVLAAVAKDCNNKMFPISWAVVEKENEETWTWFFQKLFEDLGISDGFGWTFMSDKHWGIINGIRKLAPHAEHRHCARHIYANWRKKFRDRKFKLLFWEAVKLTNEAQFKEKLLELKDVSPEAYEAFMDQVPSKFCKSLVSQVTVCIQNNICETFNSYILKSRDKPIIEMLEYIRKHIMTKMCKMLDNINSKTDLLTPGVRKQLTKLQDGVKYCKLYPAGEKSMRDDPNKYVDAFYLRQNSVETYKHGLSPIHDPKEWPIVEGPHVLPPTYVRQPGRPKKNRRKDPSEVPKQGQKKLPKTGVKMSCRKCGEIGHNTRTCKVEGNVEPKPKGKRGRPRVPKPTALQQVARREIGQGTQNYGVLYGESRFIYVQNPRERRVNTVHNPRAQIGKESSQRSQVVDRTT